MIRAYYRLTKPGIVYGNAITALAAFVFASGRHGSMFLLLSLLLGLSLAIASACVVNNIMDRDIDARMARTKERAIPTGSIPVSRASAFAFLLFLIGFAVLLAGTNILTALATLFGVVVYVCLYTPAKRLTVHSTLIGAVAGAVPPVVGYTAATNALDATALLLFLILVCWQMTHFFAIAIFRLADYRDAHVPVMPVRFGIFRTKAWMTVYAFLFSFALYGLSVERGLGSLFNWPLGLVAVGWIALSAYGFHAQDERRWARRMFLYSIVAILVFCLCLAFS